MKYNIIKVLAVSYYSAALSSEGFVFLSGETMGSKHHPQLFHNKYNQDHMDISSFKKINPIHFNNEPIIDIKLSSNFCCATSKQGNIYVWNCDVAMGHDILLDNSNNSELPNKINDTHFNAEKIISIYSTSYYSFFALTNKKNLYAWGINENQQLGVSSDDDEIKVPMLIDPSTYNNETIKHVETDQRTTIILTEEGNLYSCGSNCDLYLGSGEVKFDQKKYFSKISFDDGVKIKKISIGFLQCVALSCDGKVYQWGVCILPYSETECCDCKYYNMGDENGLDENTERTIPELIDPKKFNNEKIVDIDYGRNIGLFLSESNHLYTWGENVNGCLGCGNDDFITDVVQIDKSHFGQENIKCISTCSDDYSGGFSMVSTDYGNVYAWGTNSDGQLGLGRYEKVYNEMYPFPKNTGMGIFGNCKEFKQKMYGQLPSFVDIKIEFGKKRKLDQAFSNKEINKNQTPNKK